MAFQSLEVQHGEKRTTVYPFGPNFKSYCLYLEVDGSYVAHTTAGNKVGTLDKPRGEHTLEDLQKLCAELLPVPQASSR